MENDDAEQIYANTSDAPYINGTLIPAFARAAKTVIEELGGVRLIIE